MNASDLTDALLHAAEGAGSGSCEAPEQSINPTGTDTSPTVGSGDDTSHMQTSGGEQSKEGPSVSMVTYSGAVTADDHGEAPTSARRQVPVVKEGFANPRGTQKKKVPMICQVGPACLVPKVHQDLGQPSMSGTAKSGKLVDIHTTSPTCRASPTMKASSQGDGLRLVALAQVDGCQRDLSKEKEYYQRYRICETHLKLSSLIKDGIPQRFCQQCGRFHILADFDSDKR